MDAEHQQGTASYEIAMAPERRFVIEESISSDEPKRVASTRLDEQIERRDTDMNDSKDPTETLLDDNDENRDDICESLIVKPSSRERDTNEKVVRILLNRDHIEMPASSPSKWRWRWRW